MTSKTAAGKSAKGKGGPLQDVETLAQAMMLEAKTSLPKAARVVGKLIAVSALGFTLAGGCVGNYCSSRIVAPIGVLMLAVAAGWLDLLGNECPEQVNLLFDVCVNVCFILFDYILCKCVYVCVSLVISMFLNSYNICNIWNTWKSNLWKYSKYVGIFGIQDESS